MSSYYPDHPPIHSNPDKRINILTVADLDWRNGHEYALQACKLLKDRGLSFHYKLVGNGTFLEAVAFARHELGLESEVELILQATRKELEQLYAWADVFLLASVAPGVGQGLTQAEMRGIPIVCTEDPTLLPNIIGKKGMYIASKRNPQALAIKLEEATRMIQGKG